MRARLRMIGRDGVMRCSMYLFGGDASHGRNEKRTVQGTKVGPEGGQQRAEQRSGGDRSGACGRACIQTAKDASKIGSSIAPHGLEHRCDVVELKRAPHAAGQK